MLEEAQEGIASGILTHEVFFRREPSAKSAATTVTVRLGGPARAIVGCLESIRLQTAADLDLIVIDQGAPDEDAGTTLRWLAAHATRFGVSRLIRSPGGGKAGARNLAFRTARTPNVLMMEDTEILYPRCVAALESALGASLADFAYCSIDTTGAHREILGWRPWEPEAWKSGPPIEPMALVSRDAWGRVGARDESAGPAEDDFYRRIAESGGWGILVPEFLARRRIRPASGERPERRTGDRRLEFEIESPEGARDIAARTSRDDREIRALRADLELIEWHAPERLAREATIPTVPPPVPPPASDPDLIVLAGARRLRDRLMPAGTLRRLSGLLIRAARILAAEGPRSLGRRASRKLARALHPAARRTTRGEPPHPEPATSDPMRVANVTPIVHGGAPPRQPPRPHITPMHGPARFSLLSSSLGNCYFHQIRDLIAAGIAELGHDVVCRSEEEGFRDDVDWHVVVAPHEFFFLGRGEELRRSEWPPNVIIVSTEQPSTTWFALAWECLGRAHAVWDIDHNTSLRLRERGIPSDYLPLGYAPGYADYGLVAELPPHYGTGFLGDEIRRSPAAGGPLRDRPIDVFFVGGRTPRREAFFARAAPALADHRAYLHIFDTSRPSRVGTTTYMDTATVIGLSQRSRVLLNVHHGTDVYFEWQRIVLQGIWQRTLVVSEPCSLAPPFRAGVHYVEADLDRIPGVLRYYLDDPRGRREAQEIADAGHESLVSECRLSRFLEVLLTRHAATGAVLDHFERHRSRSGSLRLAAS